MNSSHPSIAIMLIALCSGCGMISDVVGPKQEAILEDVAEELVRDEIKGVPSSSR